MNKYTFTETSTVISTYEFEAESTEKAWEDMDRGRIASAHTRVTKGDARLERVERMDRDFAFYIHVSAKGQDMDEVREHVDKYICRPWHHVVGHNLIEIVDARIEEAWVVGE